MPLTITSPEIHSLQQFERNNETEINKSINEHLSPTPTRTIQVLKPILLENESMNLENTKQILSIPFISPYQFIETYPPRHQK